MDNGAFVWMVNYQTSGSVRGGEALLLPATNGVEGMSPPTTDSHGDTVHWTGGAGEGGRERDYWEAGDSHVLPFCRERSRARVTCWEARLKAR